MMCYPYKFLCAKLNVRPVEVSFLCSISETIGLKFYLINMLERGIRNVIILLTTMGKLRFLVV